MAHHLPCLSVSGRCKNALGRGNNSSGNISRVYIGEVYFDCHYLLALAILGDGM
jgi:hypothetical protein